MVSSPFLTILLALCGSLAQQVLASAAASAASEVAVIDISPLMNDGDEGTAAYVSCARQVMAALQDKGLFLATNSGVGTTASFVDAAFEASLALFSLPEEQKMQHKMQSGVSMRGYIPFGEESGLKDAVFEPKEGYAYGLDAPAATPAEELSGLGYLRAPNQWPQSLPAGARQTLQRVYEHAVQVAARVTRAALGDTYWDVAGIGEDAADPALYEGGADISVMRLFHYLPTGAEGRDDSVLGSSAHTDWGLLTVILQDAVGGLEYLDGGVWRAVPAVQGSLVINGGDYLHLLRPALVSPIHRVLAPVDQHRMSFVFFYYPEFFTPMPSALPAAEGREGKGGKVAFNTLLQGLPAGLQRQGQGQGQGGEGISFGAHIINKWAGVRRY